jgi:uncharacterized protein YndB with AHSA1/START domain
MSSSPISYKFEKTVSSSAAEVYRSFTNAMALREWLCDVATVQPRPGGRIYLAWESGYYVSGDYTKLIENKEVSFLSRGRNEPDSTQVTIQIEARGGQTNLTLSHSGLLDNQEWADARREIKYGWEKGLNNLVSILGTGEDLRITQKPMLGIFFNELNQKMSHELGIPVAHGVYLENVMDGLGGKAAGLMKNDVIVELNNKPVTDHPSLQLAMRGCKAGDSIGVVYYRGAEKISTTLKLAKREITSIPKTAVELAANLKGIYNKHFGQLTELTKKSSDKDASFSPGNGEWDIKEIIAHLIHTERYLQESIQMRVFDQEQVSDGYGGNVECRIQATITAFPSLAQIMDEYHRSMIETVEMVNCLPQSFLDHKGSYWRLALELLQYTEHITEHIVQVELNLEAARK